MVAHDDDRSSRFNSCTITVMRCKDLPDIELVGKLDPYIELRIGKHKVKSEAQSGAGCNPFVGAKFVLPYEGENSAILTVKDSQVFKDREVASAKLDLDASKTASAYKCTLPLTRKGKAGGTAYLSISFSKAAISRPTVKNVPKSPSLSSSSSSSSSSSGGGGGGRQEMANPRDAPEILPRDAADCLVVDCRSSTNSSSAGHTKHKLANAIKTLKVTLHEGRGLHLWHGQRPVVSVRLGIDTLTCLEGRFVESNSRLLWSSRLVFRYKDEATLKVIVHEKGDMRNVFGECKLSAEKFISSGRNVYECCTELRRGQSSSAAAKDGRPKIFLRLELLSTTEAVGVFPAGI